MEVKLGAGWALVSAGFYAAYLVFLRRAVGGREGRMDVFLFFGECSSSGEWFKMLIRIL